MIKYIFLVNKLHNFVIYSPVLVIIRRNAIRGRRREEGQGQRAMLSKGELLLLLSSLVRL